MMNLLKNELNKTITENGAVGYKSTGSALLDMNYKVSSFRNSDEDEIITNFDKVYHENKEYALRWLFFARDVRGGLGERRLFRVCYRRLAALDFDLFRRNLPNIQEYGRWDDLVSLLGFSEKVDTYVLGLISFHLRSDMHKYNDGEPVSLLAKWLPSENASSNETRLLAKKIRKFLKLSSKDYRTILSSLRKRSNVVEVQMCNNEWGDIDYERVPSMANLKYKDAFMRHDEERRVAYLDSVSQGRAKLNMNVASPVDIVSKYQFGFRSIKEYDETLELAWKNLKDIQIKDTLVVADGSGSMTTCVGGSKTMALDVANALAIYTSEHNSGVYKDKYITFSHSPQFVDLHLGKTLRDKLRIASNYHEVANTNIEAVFNLILNVAVEYEIPQHEMIKNILIISDMEFDRAQSYNSRLSEPLFEIIQKRYAAAGYQLPRLIFWNVNSRSKTVPIIENELGVTLVSGFSQNVLKMVMSNEYDPLKVLLETLFSGRYNKVLV